MSHAWGPLATTINVNELTEFVRHKAQAQKGYAQLCIPPTGIALGLGKGDTFQYIYWPDFDIEGGELDENEDIPTTGLTPVKATGTIGEYGLGTEWTGKLADLSRIDVESNFVKALVNSLKKLQNTLAFNQFQATDWFFVPADGNPSASEFDTDNAPSVTADDVCDHEQLRKLVVHAMENNIPFFDGEDYVFITGVRGIDALCYDSDVAGKIAYQSGRAALNGECGRLANCRIVRDSHKATHIGGSAAAALALNKGHLVGADAVGNEVALAPEIRAEDKFMGRKVKIAYYFMASYFKVLDQTTHGQENIIKLASA